MFGQDLKNEQWILEPLADIIISLFVMDTCYKRYSNITEGDHRDNIAEVLRLSIASHYSEVVKNVKIILTYLDDLNKSSIFTEQLDSWEQKLNYSPNVLVYKQAIVDTLYRYEKYYLNK